MIGRAGSIAAIAQLLFAAVSANAQIRETCGECKVESVSTCDGLLEGPAFDRDGTLWAVAPTKALIYRIVDGRCSVGIRMPQADAMPDGMRFLRDGTILGLDAAYGVFSADPRDGSVRYLGARPVKGHFPGANYHGLNDLAIDRYGGAYITDALGSSVLNPVGALYYRTPAGEMRLIHRGGLSFPDGIALSPDDATLYVADWRAARILKMPVVAPGEVDIDQSAVFAHLPAGVGPDGLAVDAAGNLFVADWGGGGQISVYRPDGRLIGGIRVPGVERFEPINLTFRGSWLYFTDAAGVVRRVRTRTPGHVLYGDRAAPALPPAVPTKGD